MELDQLTSADFAPYQGQDFHINYGGQQPLTVRLTKVTSLKASAHFKGRSPFSLLFHGPKEYYLRQGTYRMEHSQMGSADFFIVPVGPDENGMGYEVVFG